MNNNEPIVLGKVKKGGTGKPLLVVILFLFIGAILFLLPVINEYFKGYNIIELIRNGELINFIQNHDSYVVTKNDSTDTTTTIKIEQGKNNLINKKTILNYNNFTIDKFNLTETSLEYTINTTTNINFDMANYYLILTKDYKKTYIKLTGVVKDSKDYKFDFVNKLPNAIEVEGYIKELTVNDYTNVSIQSNESGFSTLTCQKNNEKYTYTFSNNKLIIIVDEFSYDKIDSNEYSKIYQKYINLSNKIIENGGTSLVTETPYGFKIQNNIDLSTFNILYKENLNYYSLNTAPKIINFEMEAKGFDCK